MSLWKFNNAEIEVDFTDAIFMEKFESAYVVMNEDIKHVQKTGKQSEIIRSYCNVFFRFFNSAFGEGTQKKLFGEKISIDLCVKATESIYELYQKEDARYRQISNKYNVQLRGHNKKKQYKGRQ